MYRANVMCDKVMVLGNGFADGISLRLECSHC